jgi:hypothetical protein
MFFESRLGQKLDQMRIHTGDAAARSARDLNAHAYTVGNHVVFAKGQYNPSSNRGRRLLVHELVYDVLQQTLPINASPVIQRAAADEGDAPLLSRRRRIRCKKISNPLRNPPHPSRAVPDSPEVSPTLPCRTAPL